MKPETASSKGRASAWRCCMMMLILVHTGIASPQEIRLGDARSTAGRGHVEFLSDAIDTSGMQPATVALRFRVDPGFHINSHAPKDELLLPTELKLEPGAVKIIAEEYTPGVPFRLPVGAGDTLDVYQGEFHVLVRLVAPKGPSTLIGSLHYQACDNAGCFPPRTLPIRVAVTGK